MNVGRIVLMAAVVAGALLPAASPAATTLSVSPITWNVVGLDSNDVNVGPNHFPVGARVCNTGAAVANNVGATFVWDSANAYVNLRPGTGSTITLPSLAVGACDDFYFEVEVTRNAAAYDTTRRYHIAVSADGGATTGSTPTPREFYVEHLVSQSRNYIIDMQLSTDGSTFSSVAEGGTMTLMVGNTYWIKLVGTTATQGYEQIESFINFPNTIFQVLAVTTTYSAPVDPTVIDLLYGDACTWENDPNSPNYRSCLGTGKEGGNTEVIYELKILQIPGAPLVNPEPLSTLIYDFSGSSFHYNSDYGVTTRYANIVNATLAKAFSPKTITAGGTSTLTFTITNPGPKPLTGVNFADAAGWPAGMSVNSTSVTYTNCGAAPSPASLTVGATSVSFSNIDVAAYGTCTAAISVTASTEATYTNTTGNLLINTTVDTGSYGTDILVVSSKGTPPSTCTTKTTMVTWNFGTAPATTLTPTFNVTDVSTATASSTGGTFTLNSGAGNPASEWDGSGWPTTGTSTPPNPPSIYYEFSNIDTTNYGGVSLTFDYYLNSGSWAAPANNWYYVYSKADAGAYNSGTGVNAAKGSWQTSTAYTASPTGTGTTAFRISAAGAKATPTAGIFQLDNVVISGCPRPNPPTLSKSFSPATIAQGSSSTLTFRIDNPNLDPLTGVAFTDMLPGGLAVATPNGLTAVSCATGTLTGATITAPAGSSTISLSGGALSGAPNPVATNCTFSVNVTGVTGGQYTNVSGNIKSAESGPNTTATGYGTSPLTVLAPPAINKAFDDNTVLTGSGTTLTFSITNPNNGTPVPPALTGVAFTDNLPAGLVVATPNGLSGSCGGGTISATAGSGTVSLSGATLASGATCSFAVNVTGTTVGLKVNSVQVSSTNGGTGNTATANLLVKDPSPLLKLLKEAGATATGPWVKYLGVSVPGQVYFRLTVENAGDVPLNGVQVADPTLAGQGLSLAACSWAVLPIETSESCVVGPLSVAAAPTPNPFENTATATTTTYTPGTPVTSSAKFGTKSLSLAKSVTETRYSAVGDTLNYEYLVKNTGVFSLKGPVTVDDDKCTAPCEVSCPALSTVGDGDDFLDKNEEVTCTLAYTVTAADITAVKVQNTAFATVDATASGTDSETVYYYGPTLVYLADFRATAEGGGVRVQWTTASETDTAGFHLYRLDEAAGGYRQVNRALLPALLTEAQGGTYSLLDRGADPGARLTYLLVEVEGSGTKNSYGPFTVRVPLAGANKSSDTAPVAAGRAGAAEDPLAGYTRKPRPLSAKKAARIKERKAALDRHAARLAARTGATVKIAVERDGLYRIGAEQIASQLGTTASGARGLIRQGRLAMSSQGAEVAYVPAGDASAIYFYGQGIDSIYTRENLYWLRQGKGLLARQTAGQGPAAAASGTFAELRHVEEDRFAVTNSVQDPESDYWFWGFIYAVGGTTLEKKSFPARVEGVAPIAGPIGLTVNLRGFTAAQHRVVVRLNGTPLSPDTPGADAWSGAEAHAVSYTTSQDLLHDGDNTIEVEGVPAGGELPSIFYVDSFDISYRRLYRAVGDSLLLRGDGNPVVTVTGLTTPDVVVLDVSNPLRPRLQGAVTVGGAPGNYAASFTPSTPEARYFVGTASAAAAGRAWADSPSSLSSTANAADYLLVTTGELADAAAAYADHWSGRGLAVKIALLEDVMDEFNHGIYNPDALHDFLAYAHQSWGVPPTYVLLAGEGTYDYKDLMGYRDNLIPVKMQATPTGLAPADNSFADADGDFVPDVAIGRLPVATAAELEGMRVKLASYDPGRSTTLLFVADDPDRGGDFPADSDTMAAAVLPGHTIKKIYLSVYPWEEARKQLLDGIRDGARFLNYTGHAAVDRFEESGLLSTGDVPALGNATLPVVTALTCVAGQFSHPGYDSLSEFLVTRQGGGAVAFFGATGMAYNEDSVELGRLFYETVFSEGVGELGPAIRRSLEKFRGSSGRSYILDIYTLQGDPALRITP